MNLFFPCSFLFKLSSFPIVSQNPRCEVHENVSMVGSTNLFEKIKNVFYLRTKRTIRIESKLLLSSFKLLNTSKTIHRLITLTNKSKTETVAKLCEIKSYEVWKKFRIISPRFKIFSSKLVQNSKTSPSTALPLRQTQQSWKFQYCTVRRCCLGQSRGEQVAATCVVTPLKKGRGERERERERVLPAASNLSGPLCASLVRRPWLRRSR